MARKTKYTPERVEKIVRALGLGMTIDSACALAGIHPDTYFTWVNRHAEFSDRTTRAREEGWQTDLAIIKAEALKGDWRAAAEHLDRTASPYRKSTDMNLRHSGADGGPLTVSIIRDHAPEDE